MVRLLIEDITIRKGEQIQLDVRFRGACRNVDVASAAEFLREPQANPALVAKMDGLLDDYNYADVARILNENGFKTGDGLPLTSPAVGYIRTAYGLKSRFDRFRERGMLTTLEIARRCGVSTNTIADWRRKAESVCLPLTIETNFSLKIPGRVDQTKVHGRRQRADFCPDLVGTR